MSLPGAETTEPTTILQELNRNFIEPVAAQVTGNNANENEHTHDLNIDNDRVSDVGKCNQLTDSQSDVTDEVNRDNEPIVHSDKLLCDSDRNDGFEILNFNLQTIEDIDEKLGQAESTAEVKKIGEENKICDDALVDSSDIKSPSSPSSSCDNTGKSVREASPPPVPLDTYRWEDVKRDKQKVRFEEVKSFRII